jgi:hypothetical protein
MREIRLGVLLILAACDPGDVVLIAPDTAPTTRVVSMRVLVDTPYAVIAASLGWSDGVPGAQVRLHRMTEPYDGSYWTVAVTETTGVATFPDLLYGLYEVEVSRLLTAAESSQASGARVLAGGRRTYLPTPRMEDVTMAPDGHGSLVFSEISVTEPESYTREYPDAKYFEVHNNSDTTIYLDGKYWGIGWDLNRDYPAWPCSQTGVVRNDPEGIWTRIVLRFPGQGIDHPLAPGQTALIAKAAIDHRAVDPRLWDLSHADFEWGGYRTADNPDVPNLEGIGLQAMGFPLPHAEQPLFLSEPVDLATLPRYTDPFSGRVWVRVPAAAVLDVWVGAQDWTTTSYTPVASCLESAHRYFERLPGPAFAGSDFDNGLSEQRRVLTVLPDGRKILQDTNTSMADFVKAPRTPGWIP